MIHQANTIDATQAPAVMERQRDRSIDLARGVALVLMVMVHVIYIWDLPTVSADGSLIYAMVSPIGAPTFLFLMGINFALSSKTHAWPSIYRGCQLIALGYFLNFLRGTIPVFLGDWTGLITINHVTWLTPWHYLIEVDILQCVGLSLIVLAIIRKYCPWPKVWALLAALSILGILIPSEAAATNSFGSYFASLFRGARNYIYFPLLPWITFPLAGMAYGAMKKKAAEKGRFEFRGALAGLALIIAGSVMVLTGTGEGFGNLKAGFFLDGKLTPGMAVTFIGIQLLWLPLCGFISRTIDITPFAHRIYFWSENVTTFYFIQWIVIGWLSILTGEIATWLLGPMIVVVLLSTDRVLSWRSSPLPEKGQMEAKAVA